MDELREKVRRRELVDKECGLMRYSPTDTSHLPASPTNMLYLVFTIPGTNVGLCYFARGAHERCQSTCRDKGFKDVVPQSEI